MHGLLLEVALVRCFLRLSPTFLTTQFYLYLWTELKCCCLHSIALPSTACGEFWGGIKFTFLTAVRQVVNVEADWQELVAPVSEACENLYSISLRSAQRHIFSFPFSFFGVTTYFLFALELSRFSVVASVKELVCKKVFTLYFQTLDFLWSVIYTLALCYGSSRA